MSFTEKKGKDHPDVPFDHALEDEILKAAEDQTLSCDQCFRLCGSLGISTASLGRFADHHQIRLVRCQMGLFGHGPGKKKSVRKLDSVPQTLMQHIIDRLDDGKLTCESAWEIATMMKIPKMEVSGACETLGIRIKQCQIGAF